MHDLLIFLERLLQKRNAVSSKLYVQDKDNPNRNELFERSLKNKMCPCANTHSRVQNEGLLEDIITVEINRKQTLSFFGRRTLVQSYRKRRTCRNCAYTTNQRTDKKTFEHLRFLRIPSRNKGEQLGSEYRTHGWQRNLGLASRPISVL
jgi:hypothetical protein